MGKVEVTSSMAQGLAKNLLGKCEEVSKEAQVRYDGSYVYVTGSIRIKIKNMSEEYSSEKHKVFESLKDVSGSTYMGQCYLVEWYVPGVQKQIAYFTIDTMEPIYVSFKNEN